MIFYKEFFFKLIFFIQHFFINIFFILTTDKKLAEIEITLNICWFR